MGSAWRRGTEPVKKKTKAIAVSDQIYQIIGEEAVKANCGRGTVVAKLVRDAFGEARVAAAVIDEPKKYERRQLLGPPPRFQRVVTPPLERAMIERERLIEENPCRAERCSIVHVHPAHED